MPEGTIAPQPGYHAVLQNRMLRDGLLNAYWVQVNNNLQAAANINDEGYPGYRNPENFIVVSEAYPTVTAQAADLILPTAMWVEKEGAYGNAERRTQFWHQLVEAPGEARSDLWQLMEFSRRFKIEEVWPPELIAKKPEYRGKTMFDVLFRNGEIDKFPLTDIAAGYENHEFEGLRLLCAEGTVRGVRPIRPRPRARPRAVRQLPRDPRPALAGRQRQGNALALPRGLRPLREGRHGRAVLRLPRWQGAHFRPALRAAGRISRQRNSRIGW